MGEKKIRERLSGLWLSNSTSFAGQTETLSIGRNCESIVPARIDFDCRAVAIDKNQRADGFLVRTTKKDPTTRAEYVEQVFVGWANVREVQFSE